MRSRAGIAACAGVAVVAAALFLYTEKPLFWLLLLLCPAMHLWMMRDTHRDGPSTGKAARRENRSCH